MLIINMTTLSPFYHMLKSRLFIACLLLCSASSSNKAFGQCADFAKRYTLDFQFSDSIGMGAWQYIGKDFLLYLKDTVPFNGKYAFGITRMYVKKYLETPLQPCIGQNIPLCTTDAKEGMLSITLKTRNLINAELVVRGIDQLETVLYTYRTPILNDNTWSTYTSKFPLKDAALLNVSINLLGGDDSLHQVVWFDRLELKVDGKEPEVCDDNPRFSYPPVSTLTTYPLSLSDPYTYRNIPDIKKHSILAIGESIHGSRTMNKIGFDFMKYCIEREEACLMLLELPLESMLAVNRYIQGDERFKLEDILKKEAHSLFSNKQMGDFFRWLKGYNQGRLQKVWFLGIDVLNNFIRSLELVNYFQTINQTAQLPVLDSLCVGLLNKRPFDELAEMIRKESAINNLFSEVEYQILLHCLERPADALNTQTASHSSRDYIMFQNTDFLINTICKNQEKCVIYTHFNHANYTTQHLALGENASFGSYMKKAYPDYFCFGVFAGEGRYLSKGGLPKLGFTESTLPNSIASSLESSLLQHPNDYFYLPSPPSQLSLLRIIGNMRRVYPFEAINLAQRVGGVLFIKQSEAIELDAYRTEVEHLALYWQKKQQEFRSKYPEVFK